MEHDHWQGLPLLKQPRSAPPAPPARSPPSREISERARPGNRRSRTPAVAGEGEDPTGATYLRGHFTKERDFHFLTLGHQRCEERLVRPFGVINGWLVALEERRRVVRARVPEAPPPGSSPTHSRRA